MSSDPELSLAGGTRYLQYPTTPLFCSDVCMTQFEPEAKRCSQKFLHVFQCPSLVGAVTLRYDDAAADDRDNTDNAEKLLGHQN